MISVLFVDDEPPQCELVKRVLEMEGEFTVDTFDSAPEALASENLSRYDAIVSDFQMGGMDGIGFLQQIRASGSNVPFIILSGKGREDVVIRALNEGADFYLQKGANSAALFADLKQKIRTAVQRRKDERALLEIGQRYYVLYKKAPLAALLSGSTDDVIADANEAFEETFGYTRRELLGRTVADTGLVRDPLQWSQNLTLLYRQGRLQNLETVLYTKSGGALNFLANLSLVTIRGREYVLTMGQDITGNRKP